MISNHFQEVNHTVSSKIGKNSHCKKKKISSRPIHYSVHYSSPNEIIIQKVALLYETIDRSHTAFSIYYTGSPRLTITYNNNSAGGLDDSEENEIKFV